MGEKWEVGGVYRNRKGWYEVLGMDGGKMLILYENGVRATVSMEVQARILEQMKYEEEHVLRSSLDLEGDVSGRVFLRRSGFQSIGTIGRLMGKSLPTNARLSECGLYAVTVSDGYEARFLEASAAKNVVSPWALARLEAKWVPGAEIVYLGKAEASLRQRLEQLLGHGAGTKTNHRGGEILWQLDGNRSFEIWVLATAGRPVPSDLEYAYLEGFRKANSGRLPFANKNRGTQRIQTISL